MNDNMLCYDGKWRTHREIAAAALDLLDTHPELHDQTSWIEPRGDSAFDERGEPECGTTMCSAGAVVYVLDGPQAVLDTHHMEFPSVAGKALGLDCHERQALFFCAEDQAARDALRALADGDREKFAEVLEGAVRF